jgi:NADH-quinone oxidoreductase subunit J
VRLVTTAFLIAACVAVASTLFVVTRASAVHALLYLIVSLLATAVMFLTLGAPFVAALEVVVYAGAVMVLFVFAAMMLNLGPDSAARERAWLAPTTWLGPAALAGVLAIELLWILTGSSAGPRAGAISPEEVATSLFSAYLVAVEIVSLLLMAGLVGAYHLGRRSQKGSPE